MIVYWTDASTGPVTKQSKKRSLLDTQAHNWCQP